MNVRSQTTMVFHLDKCIGCHTCSVACKNLWTDREGSEYMWWNNVETKPGTGYPSKWEDQKAYKGGWKLKKNGKITLVQGDKAKTLKNIFHNPYMPEITDYYEPYKMSYEELFTAPQGDDQPTARPISLITGKPMDIKGGPNWDDDLSGTQDYARKDSNLEGVPENEKQALFELERMTMFYLPRMCNHCLNPACIAACPSGAIYKRGEDGVVLINNQKCRAWRMCVSACPYKKAYYNWKDGKSEKCILCFPRLETGQAPACMHTCVGRIRYLGVMLYDADRIEEVASAADSDLLSSQMSIYLDPHDPEVIEAAKANGIPDSTLEVAKKSPVYKFVKEWGIALPLHPEFRTVPNLFYVPPLISSMGSVKNGSYKTVGDNLWGSIEESRLPVQYLANLFSNGDTDVIRDVLKKLMVVRNTRRLETVGDVDADLLKEQLEETGYNEEIANAIYRMSSLPTMDDRIVIAPAHREEAIEMLEATADHKGSTGFGHSEMPRRIH